MISTKTLSLAYILHLKHISLRPITFQFLSSCLWLVVAILTSGAREELNENIN